jgi:hypothetical protein
MLYKIGKTAVFLMILSWFMSCAPRYGCPSNGTNIGAERYLNGSKVPKVRKMKV